MIFDYDWMMERADAGDLPVFVLVDDETGLTYTCSYKVESWSKLAAGTDAERENALIGVIRATHLMAMRKVED